MNNLFNRFYFFTKFSTSIILLSLLVLVSYLFIKSYLGQTKDINYAMIVEEQNVRLNNLLDLSTKNSDNINSINSNIKLKLDQISDENKELKNEINVLLTNINNLKKPKDSLKKNSDSDIVIKNLINLMILKLENGESFFDELNLLGGSKLNNLQFSYLEKLSILNSKNFSGLENLYHDFDKISSDYLNYYYFSKNNNFSKHLGNLFLIQPNINSDIKNVTVKSLAIAKKNLLKKNLEISIKQIVSIDNGEEFFSPWINNANIYLETKIILEKFVE